MFIISNIFNNNIAFLVFCTTPSVEGRRSSLNTPFVLQLNYHNEINLWTYTEDVYIGLISNTQLRSVPMLFMRICLFVDIEPIVWILIILHPSGDTQFCTMMGELSLFLFVR